MAGDDDRQDERRRLSEQNKGGPVDERLHGVIDDSADDDDIGPGGRPYQGSGHVSGDVEWVPSDEDDPDGGSGRTDADDGGYLPGEGTGHPYR